MLFGIEQGVGGDNLCRYFKMLRLDTHIGVSPSAIRTKLNQLQELIITFQTEFEKANNNTLKQVIGAADETFFGDLLILVFMDLSSGYLVLEDIADDRRFDTWLKKCQPRLEELNIEVQLMISDRARALIKLAFDGFQCDYNSDIFHAQYDISKWLGSTLGRRASTARKELVKCETELEKAKNSKASESKLEAKEQNVVRAEAQCQEASGNLEEYQGTNRTISETVHPFSIENSEPQDSNQAEKKLRKQGEKIETIANDCDIPDKRGVVNKFKNQISDLVPTIDFWWSVVGVSLAGEGVKSKELMNWLMFILLPVAYWYMQMNKTKNTNLRKQYKKTWENALSILHGHVLTQAFSEYEEDFLYWQSWALTMVEKFHRASSAVEGRNGFLSQIYHNRRGISENRLKALTVLHNYFITRADGSTAAERFFGKKPPDLLDWLICRMGELPLPRESKKTVHGKSLNLGFVPA